MTVFTKSPQREQEYIASQGERQVICEIRLQI